MLMQGALGCCNIGFMPNNLGLLLAEAQGDWQEPGNWAGSQARSCLPRQGDFIEALKARQGQQGVCVYSCGLHNVIPEAFKDNYVC